jgi:hypothetical protein
VAVKNGVKKYKPRPIMAHIRYIELLKFAMLAKVGINSKPIGVLRMVQHWPSDISLQQIILENAMPSCLNLV